MRPVSDRTTGWELERLALIFVTGTLVNYPWELAQAPLYEGMSDLWIVLWHCLPASLGDGALLLLIFAVGGLALRRADWFERPGVSGYLVMLAAGLIIAVGIEWVAVHVAERWTYTDAMPRIPGLDIGIVPVAQMLVLPPLIFGVVTAALRRKREFLGTRR